MSQTKKVDLILRNARIIDGTGGPGPHIWGIRGYRPKLHGHIPNQLFYNSIEGGFCLEGCLTVKN